MLVASSYPILMLEGQGAPQDNQFISVGLTAAPTEDLRVILRTMSMLTSRTSIQTPNILVFPAANRSSQSWWLPQTSVLSALNDHINNMPGSLIYPEGVAAAVSNRTSAVDAVWAAMSTSSAWSYSMPVGLDRPQSAPVHTKYVIDADAAFVTATRVPKFTIAGETLSFDIAPAIWPAVPTLDFLSVTIVVGAGNTSNCIAQTAPQRESTCMSLYLVATDAITSANLCRIRVYVGRTSPNCSAHDYQHIPGTECDMRHRAVIAAGTRLKRRIHCKCSLMQPKLTLFCGMSHHYRHVHMCRY
jgi:hypothetical protein